MAQSPSHKFGQIIGDLLEEMLHAPLSEVAERHDLYLDFKHARQARGNKKKVSWTDNKNNTHDLDYVLEHGGSEDRIGTPKAFIESAWRRYTKHSRNKAQEIQGAVSVLAATYSEHNPFLGVVLAGVFTAGSLSQLESHGFRYLYCSYDTVVAAFAKVGIDAAFDEETTTDALWAKVRAYEALDATHHATLIAALRALVQSDLDEFLKELEKSLNRHIERIFIAGLHGPTLEVASVEEAVAFITKYAEDVQVSGFVRYEVDIRYSNGDHINGEFDEKTRAIAFLTALV